MAKRQVLEYFLNGLRVIDNKVRGLKVKCQWDTTNEAGDTFGNSCVIDFENMPIQQLADYAVSTLIIRRQGPERKVSKAAALVTFGKTIHWSLMGHTIVSQEKQQAIVENTWSTLDRDRKLALYEKLKAELEPSLDDAPGDE